MLEGKAVWDTLAPTPLDPYVHDDGTLTTSQASPCGGGDRADYESSKDAPTQ